MPQWAKHMGFIEFTDRRRHKTVRRFNLDGAMEDQNDPVSQSTWNAANVKLNALVAAIEPLTTAEITRYGIITATQGEEEVGPVGSDVTDEILLNYALQNHPGKVWTGSLPSPAVIVFEGDNDLIRVNPTQTDVAAFSLVMSAVSNPILVSDGEQIDGTQGTNGLLSGVWRSKQKRAKPS